ncbi:glycosyltransferase family 4 protein [Rhodohalobacter sulfatireducens]|uniref:Glycosyltransferase family 1 protein n=1 Tax=Rhodohalobacter sulfatireducens TaxID=2911366 RepID=A0ABS9KIL5_9BACT|nr:glycosyltransferase family 1 protein [Rhodohalobacter sulfatireducens]MCG2590686.1 glycosyltransferase family 1 protein [Rhodohalobacter sulfatireducens]
MRVAIFTGNYNHIKDGVSITLNRLVDYLQKNEVEVLVFGPTVPDPAIDHVGRLVPIPSMKMPGRPEYRFTIWFPKKAKNVLEIFQPDLLHLATPDILGIKALLWAEKKGIPVVSSYHTHFSSYLKYYKLSAIESFFWNYLEWFYGKCRQVYVPSESMAEILKKNNIKTNLKLWERGIDRELFNPSKRDMEWRRKLGFKDEDIVISFVSRLVWEKNLKLFATVVQRLKNKYASVKAMVVGEGPARNEMMEMLPKAEFTGFLEGENLARAYASSDIFFFPSDTETFGNVTLEAMACGLPAVVADATGSKSLVDHGENGFRAPVERSDKFFTLIERLILDASLRDKMSKASLEKSKDYRWDSINGKLLDYYKEVLDT